MKDLLIIGGVVLVIILLLRSRNVKQSLSPYQLAQPVTVISNGVAVTPSTQVNTNALDGLQMVTT